MIKQTIIQHAVQALIAALPPNVLAEGADRMLDLVENMIERSDTKVDDAVVMPIIRLIRTSFNIPDNDP